MALWKDTFRGGGFMRYGHLERYEIHLHTLAPVFIGSGESLSKKEYIFDQRNGKVHMPDLARLTGFLAKHSLLPEFEHFMFQSENNNLHAFLSDIGIKPSDYPAFVTYTIDAGDTDSTASTALTFMNADGKPHIFELQPGSDLACKNQRFQKKKKIVLGPCQCKRKNGRR